MSQKRSAFLFGANGPEGASLKPLQYAQNDIRHLKTAFSSSFCNFHQVADHIADTSHILMNQLERFVYTCERPDLLVVHFSGHGFVWNGQLYLLCNTTDVDARLFNSTAISIAQIKTVLDQCSAKHKLLILDCCFAGIAQGVGAWKSEEQLPGLESLKGSVNAILAACPAHRRTRELDTLELYQEKGAGFLTWAIACACDKQFTQVAREDTLSLSDILDWLPSERDNINKYLSSEDRIPAPRILNQRDLVGDDEIWFTSRRRSNSYHEILVEKRQSEEHALFQHLPFLQQPCPGARSEDLDANSVQEYAQHDGDAAYLPLGDLPTLCQQLGLTSTIGTPLKAAVLAFHKTPSRYIHSALIRTTYSIPDKRDDYLQKDIKGSLGKQAEHALHWLLGNLRTISEHVDAGKRVDRCEIPEKALHELIVNAILHREYEANPSVQIKITPKQVIITNPGQLDSAITMLDQPFFFRDSLPANPFLLNVLIAQNWAEGRSRGFAVVTEEFQKYGLPLPEIKNLDSGLVQVIIQRPEFDTFAALPVWTVPHQRNPHFTGREELLDQLHQRLTPAGQDDPTATRRAALTQPQAIKGLGGIGKTQIAVEYAYRSRDLDRYTHTLWINAAAEETIITSFVTIAESFTSSSAKNETDQRKLVQAVIRWLEQCKQRWLMIFDNADDLSIIQMYLPQKGNGSVLLTTRANAVGSLAASIEVEMMGLMEGVQFLLHRAQRFNHASDEEINEAENIVIALDHFPLALDQAGAYVEETKCSFVDYLQIYQNHRGALLARRGLQTTNYPDSVATTWSLSFQKVEQANPAAAELLCLCAFLAPDAIPEELFRDSAHQWGPLLQQAVVDLFTFNQMIAELLRFSLVRYSAETQTLSIHRLVQAVLLDTIELDVQHQWAERVIRAVNEVFPHNPQDVTTWSQYRRYLDQVQACNILIRQYTLTLTEASDLLLRTGRYLSVFALYIQAEPLFQRALAIREQQLGSHHSDTATPISDLADLYRGQGKYAEAEALYMRSLRIREQALGLEHPDVAYTLNGLANLYENQGKYVEAEALYQRVLAIRQQTFGAEHPDVASSFDGLAVVYSDQGKYEQAETLYQRALRIREQQLGSEHPDTAISLNNLANLYREQGKYAQAEPLYEQALHIIRRVLGEEHPNTATSLNYLALLYQAQGRYEQAEPLYEQSLRISQRVLGGEHPNTAISLNNLANLYLDQGKYTQAEPLFQQAIAIQRTALGETHPYVATSLNKLAELYYKIGDYAQAEPLFQQVLVIRRAVLGEAHPDVADSLSNLGQLYHAMGNYEQAELLYLHALRIWEEQLGPEHPQAQALRRSYVSLLGIMRRDEKFSHEPNNDARPEESISSDKMLDKTFKKETGMEKLVSIITFDNVSPIEANHYVEELSEVLLGELPMISVQRGRSEHYSQDLGNTLIVVLRAPEIVAAVTTIKNWLQRRNKVSLTIETPDHKAIARNINAANAARLTEIFLSQQ